MRKLALSAAISTLLFAGITGQAAAATTYFSENFSNLNAWTRSGYSFATVSDGILSFSSGNSGGDIFTTASFTNAVINFDYRGTANTVGGGFVGLSEGFPGSHGWLAGAGGYGTPVTLINDGKWNHYSIAFTGTGHIMLEQFATNVAGAGQFRNLSVSDVALPAVPEPETYGMLLAGLALIGGTVRRRSKTQ
ncbi:PEP-CTERM sorting domain-containing protein [Massilia sp. BJB1822]|uniref:PEP-CTERM sorting domain-containing protein n=1 Tax=Massilia sp. BJB1822 TaxID=2744470 RepID=UPI001593F2B4|nr:PEP-CTERM sorting domain-containing protein [Massilia sp. BJB1822]NVD99510.1 PEP-CTERM sorting domain-containing protein [Massilia sp. BJB1822]